MRVHFVCRDGARWQRILAEQSQSLVQVKPTQGAGNDPNLGQAYGHQIVALNPIDQGRGEKPPVSGIHYPKLELIARAPVWSDKAGMNKSRPTT